MLAFSVEEKDFARSVAKATKTVQLESEWEKFKQSGQDQDCHIDEPP